MLCSNTLLQLLLIFVTSFVLQIPVLHFGVSLSFQTSGCGATRSRTGERPSRTWTSSTSTLRVSSSSRWQTMTSSSGGRRATARAWVDCAVIFRACTCIMHVLYMYVYRVSVWVGETSCNTIECYLLQSRQLVVHVEAWSSVRRRHKARDLLRMPVSRRHEILECSTLRRVCSGITLNFVDFSHEELLKERGEYWWIVTQNNSTLRCDLELYNDPPNIYLRKYDVTSHVPSPGIHVSILVAFHV